MTRKIVEKEVKVAYTGKMY